MKLKYYFIFLIPILVSSFVVYISLDIENWKAFWSFINIPYQIPPFSDLDAISKAVDSKEAGFDPYLNNPFDLKFSSIIFEISSPNSFIFKFS